MTSGIARSETDTLIVRQDSPRYASPVEQVATPARATVSLWQQASQRQQEGQYREVLIALDRILEIVPDSYAAWHWRGNALSNLGQYEAALASYDRALILKPNHLLVRLERQIVQLFWQISQFLLGDGQ
jgi:tetratricopeptide (TPR) repeat protein